MDNACLPVVSGQPVGPVGPVGPVLMGQPVGPVGSVLPELSDQFHVFGCPHCQITIVVAKNEVACSVFRCGVLKDSFVGIPSHASQQECEQLVQQEKIYGCGKPFTFFPDRKVAEKCGYI